MSEANLRQIRVLHIVSAGGVANSLQPSLFMPLLTRLPRQRVKAQVACLSPGAVPSAVLRQNGVPTFDLALSRKRFSPTAFGELVQSARHFRPDVIQAWGHTAQILSTMLRKRCDWKPRLVWSLADTAPLTKNAGFIDRQKLKYAAKFAARADRIVYTSEAAAAQHRRVGFPDGGHETVPPGVDATRFKPDFAARRRLREELSLPGETFVIGMAAPFQPEFDHSTLLKGIGELVKINPNLAVVLAGHGVQKGNAPLMALIGGGALATRVHLLGEWSDVNALYNACDVVCSSAVNDQSRMNVVMAMLCGVPCVATGIGAQGEVIGQHGVAVEPGNPAAFVKGITRVMQLSAEKRTHLAQGARKHALANYVYVRSLQKYLQLYYDLIGRQSLVSNDLPTPEIDATLTVPPALPSEAEMNASKRKPITVVDLSDPDSLESKVAERAPEELPKWRIEQEEERKKREAELAAQVAASKSVGDVLQVFEVEQAKAASSETPMTERARGVADDTEELLSPELLAAEVPVAPRASHSAASSKKASSSAPAPAVSAQDAAKQAALKAARMAALQPITPPSRPVAAPKAPAAVTRPPATKASPATRPPASPSPAIADDFDFALETTKPAAAVKPESAKVAASLSTSDVAKPAANISAPDLTKAAANIPAPDVTKAAANIPAPDVTKAATNIPAPEVTKAAVGIPAADLMMAAAAAVSSDPPKSPAPISAADAEPLDIGSTQPIEMLPESALLQAATPGVPGAPTAEQKASGDAPDMLPDFSLLPAAELNASTAPVDPSVADLGGTPPLDLLPEITLLPPIESTMSPAPAAEPVQAEAVGLELPEMLPEIALFLDPQAHAIPVSSSVSTRQDSVSQTLDEPSSAPSSPPAASSVAAEPAKKDLLAPAAETQAKAAPTSAAVPSVVAEQGKKDVPAPSPVAEPVKKTAFDSPQPMGMFSQALANATLRLAAFTAKAAEASQAPSNEQPAKATATLVSARPAVDKNAATSPESSVAHEQGRDSAQVTSTGPTTNNESVSELALLATGQWMTMQWPGVKSEPTHRNGEELSGAEALSLISTPAPDTTSDASRDPTVKLALLQDPAAEPKRAANAK
ncbi:glycosyltransferase [Steroidobacter sp. S1-65]|uniref:Glycosyltransferase n=1 Tax=Steroidobacter gossypii TaxID=2805490 RepID=A0ABS1WU89_9GAMM|nr:glycosyltransferase [Steroidobacter gossypii]MBM0104544.1 glycosyltransferase [Steroidobacter gossypii]